MPTTSSRARYEILGTLGSGATSRVDKARDTILGRTVAVQTLVHSFGAPVEQKQFLREAQIVSQLSDPAIVNLYDVGIEDGSIAYLVMEYVPGKTLQQVRQRSVLHRGFADQTVVYTTELRDGHAVQLERALAAGPHQLRVALYRPDKSLQVMKEGLGEIRTDSPNAVKIQ